MTAVNERLRDYCERTPQASFHDLTSVFVEVVEGQVCNAFVAVLHLSRLLSLGPAMSCRPDDDTRGGLS